MYCPRLDHFVRFNANGTVGKCGHMVDAPGFDCWQSMQTSEWVQQTRATMDKQCWPKECQRCQHTEQYNNSSVRLNAIERDKSLSQIDANYVILGGVLDNICNSACQSCNAKLSTKIGSLSTKDFERVDNSLLFKQIPWEQIVELDLNGGEPTASPAYQSLLENLPPRVQIIRVNTNGSRVLPNLKNILQRNIKVVITLSLDGTGSVHDYVRWPINWINYQNTVQQYQQLKLDYTNLVLEAWTVVHALNAADLPDIVAYADASKLNHSWAYLEKPAALNPRAINSFTLRAKQLLSMLPKFESMANYIATESDNQTIIDNFITQQDQLRQINIKDYLCV